MNLVHTQTDTILTHIITNNKKSRPTLISFCTSTANISKPQVDNTHDTQDSPHSGPQPLVSKILTAQQSLSSGLQCHLAPVTNSCAHSAQLCPSCASACTLPWLSPVFPSTQTQLTQHVGRIQMAPPGRDHMPSTAGTMTSCYTALLALSICCWILLPTTSPAK